MNFGIKRCAWPGDKPLLIAYHDAEWGVPVHDDRKLFEMFLLSGFQAGLSWEIILKKRESLREALAGFDPEPVAAFTDRDLRRLLEDPGIIRNRLKLRAAIHNARRVLALQAESGSFAKHLWSFVGGRPISHRVRSPSRIPATSKESDALSADLKRRGFQFAGSTICYAFMQSVGMVNDHLMSCFRFRAVHPSIRPGKSAAVKFRRSR